MGKWIEPTNIVGPRFDRDKGGHTRPSGRRKAIMHFHLISAKKLLYLFCVGLKNSLCMQATWQLEQRWIKARKRACVDLVDLGQPNHNQIHVTNSEPSNPLVKSNGCDLITHSTTDKTTRGCLRTLRRRSNSKNQGGCGPASCDPGQLIACDVSSPWPFKPP